MMAERSSDYKTTNGLLQARRIDDTRLHRAFLIGLTNFLRKVVLLDKLTIIAFGIKLPHAVVIPRSLKATGSPYLGPKRS